MAPSTRRTNVMEESSCYLGALERYDGQSIGSAVTGAS